MRIDKHWATVRRQSDITLAWYLEKLAKAQLSLQLNESQMHLVRQVYKEAWQSYLEAAELALNISKQSLSRQYANKLRSPYFNKQIALSYELMRKTYVDKGFISVLGGVTLVSQTGSIKQIYLNSKQTEPVLDMMGSATTLNLGAAFPLFAAVDLIESILGIGENFALVYHASIYQQLCFDFLRGLYPNQKVDPQIFSESSGTAVNSVAIEAASAYAEHLGYSKQSKILAFKGTWSGGFGTAKEASSFGASDQLANKAGLHWVDRCLDIPQTLADEQTVLGIIKQKIARGAISGIIFEKIIGDAGIIELSDDFVAAVVQLCKNAPYGALPIIIDEIQAGNGRSSRNYWSFAHLPVVNSYECLLITTAKSAGGGKPYAYALMPKAVAKAAYPLSMLTTHSGNGPLGRAVTYAHFILQPEIQTLKDESARIVEHELRRGLGLEWRGRHLNIGVTASNGATLELLQHYLYIQYGILAGSFPSTLRFQPNLIEHPDTLVNVLQIIEQAMLEIKSTSNSSQGSLIAEIKEKIRGQKGGGLNIKL